MKFICFVTILLIFFSCQKKKEKHIDQIAALVGTEQITLNEIDSKVSQELFDQLNRIHFIREMALKELIKDKLLKLESKKQGISMDSLLNRVYKEKIDNKTIAAYLTRNNFTNTVPEFKNELKNYSIDSEKGKSIIMGRVKEKVLADYVDSLKSDVNIVKKLLPPVSQYIKLNNSLIHYRGNTQSDITVLEISDFDCEMCREHYPVMKEIYNKYKDKVRFGFTHYGSYVTPSSLASEAAFKQDRFWEMRDSLFMQSKVPDSLLIFNIAKNMNLNLIDFYNDFNNNNLNSLIEKNMLDINSSGIYGTPTILINNRLVYNSSSKDEIEARLEFELNK